MRLAFEGRAAAGLALGCLAVWVLLGLGIDSPSRAVVTGVVAGVLSALLSGRIGAGWNLFACGCAFIVASPQERSLMDRSWLYGASFMLLTLLCWVVAARVTFRVMGRSGAGEDLPPPGPTRDLQGLAAMALVTGGWLLLLFPAAPVLAVPLSMAASALVTRGLGFSRAEWPAAGALLGLLIAYVLPVQAAPALGMVRSLPFPPGTPAYPFDLAALSPHDPWLLGGMLLTGSVAGFWSARWYAAESQPA